MAAVSEPVWRVWDEQAQAWVEELGPMTNDSAHATAVIIGIVSSAHKIPSMPLRVEQVCPEHPEHRANDCGRVT